MAYVQGPHAVATAMLVATLAHAGQVDKAGRPYIDHPRRVVELLDDPSDEEKTVGWLHDVVEDTPVTLEAIEQTFGPVIADAVDAITHRPHEPSTLYYERVRQNPIARAVKIKDVTHNSDPERLAALEARDAATAARLKAKYDKALETLLRPDLTPC